MESNSNAGANNPSYVPSLPTQSIRNDPRFNPTLVTVLGRYQCHTCLGNFFILGDFTAHLYLQTIFHGPLVYGSDFTAKKYFQAVVNHEGHITYSYL